MQEWTRQPPVLSAPPKAQGTIPPCTCKLHPVLTCVARLTCTFVAIDFVDAPPVVAGFALTVIQVDLTIETCTVAQIKVKGVMEFSTF